MGWKVLAGAGTVLLAAVGGGWWAVAAVAVPPGAVIGPALVVTPDATGPSLVAPRSSATWPAGQEPSAYPTRLEAETSSPSASPRPSLSLSPAPPSPERVDPEWVRPVDGDEDEHEEDDG